MLDTRQLDMGQWSMRKKEGMTLMITIQNEGPPEMLKTQNPPSSAGSTF
jgi:hypothetical protein